MASSLRRSPNDQGRFSNGPVWVEWLALQPDVPAPRPFLAGGTNFAFGGAETTTSGDSSRRTPNIGKLIGFYLGTRGAFRDDQLVVLWGGANDFLNAGQTDPTVPVANLSAEIVTLAGATTIVVPNLPPLGRTARYAGTANEAAFDALAIQFNDLLEAGLDDLEAGLGITIIRLDTFRLFQRFLQEPTAFGFSNVTETALQTPNGDVGVGPVVENPDEYLFWDAVHPTRVTHRELGDLRNDILSWQDGNGLVDWTPIPAGLAPGR
jgi:phospholipase/lecithinase/hemolysin